MRQTEGYLADYPGFYLTAECRQCRQSKRYATDALREAIGDCLIRGLKTTIAEAWGCERVLKSGWQACQLAVAVAGTIEPPTPHQITIPRAIRAWNAREADPAIKLGDLADWNMLYGVCSCGHGYHIAHKELRNRFGEYKTLGELQPLLRCRRSRQHKNIIFALGSMQR